MSAGTEFSQSAGKIWPKSQFFEKKLKFSSSIRTFKLKYSHFGFQTFAGLSKVQIKCPLKLFSHDANFPKIHSHIQTNSVLKEAIRSFQNYCGKFVKDSFYVSKRTLRGYFVIMKYLLTFLNDFGTWQSKFRTLAILAEKTWAGSSKLFSASPEEDFEDNLLFLPLTVSFSFSKFEQIKLWISQKVPTWPSKLHSMRHVNHSQR